MRPDNTSTVRVWMDSKAGREFWHIDALLLYVLYTLYLLLYILYLLLYVLYILYLLLYVLYTLYLLWFILYLLLYILYLLLYVLYTIFTIICTVYTIFTILIYNVLVHWDTILYIYHNHYHGNHNMVLYRTITWCAIEP